MIWEEPASSQLSLPSSSGEGRRHWLMQGTPHFVLYWSLGELLASKKQPALNSRL